VSLCTHPFQIAISGFSTNPLYTVLETKDLIVWICKIQDFRKAKDQFATLCSKGHVREAFGKLRAVVALFDQMPRKNIMSCNIMIKAYLEMGNIESARNLFDEMPERNIAMWNAMVTGLAKFEMNEESLIIFSRMNELGLMPDEYSLGSVLIYELCLLANKFMPML